MSDQQPADRSALTIPFHLRGHDGMVSVFYEVNTEPSRWGFHHLDLPFDVALVKGFPVCRAEIDYAGEGYAGFMGWIQVVTVTEGSGEQWASVDVPPMLWEVDSPFSKFGYLPTMFDAPGPNPPRSDETWVAETFLTVVPDVGRSRRVRGIAGFRWGYDLEAMRATPLPLQVVTEQDWQRCVDVLRDRYPSWEFDPQFESG